ncbi:MAG: hypothetical protein ACFB50_01140 [Rubrobacteraceae bacterium]
MDLDRSAEKLISACQRLAPIHPDYANLPIQEGFNWSSCLDDVPFTRLYLVVFRSVRRPAADLETLREHDDRAYEEALRAGGLLYYFKGQVNEARECLSFCLWRSREEARAAAGGGYHRAAAAISIEMYEVYGLERFFIMRTEGTGLTFWALPTDQASNSPSPQRSARQNQALEGRSSPVY